VSWDPYAVLGVGKSAAPDEIRKAYRKLAKELHPDVRPGDKAAEDRFKRASAAYELLSDPVKRARFDRGEIDGDGNERGFAGRPDPRGGAPFEPGQDFSDLFDQFFNQNAGGGPFGADPRGRRAWRARGADLRFKLDVDFLDAVNGARRRVPLSDGRTVEVAIPPGVESGQVLRLKGQGAPGVGGGPPGDALIEVQVKVHPSLRREGDDLFLDLPISLAEAVEGAKVQAQTPTGAVALTIPAGSSSGMTLRLRNKGVASANGARGDLFVRLLIVLPDQPDDALKAFLRTWAKRDVTPERP
jgi:DnaJ-class molecular chaperone